MPEFCVKWENCLHRVTWKWPFCWTKLWSPRNFLGLCLLLFRIIIIAVIYCEFVVYQVLYTYNIISFTWRFFKLSYFTDAKTHTKEVTLPLSQGHIASCAQGHVLILLLSIQCQILIFNHFSPLCPMSTPIVGTQDSSV